MMLWVSGRQVVSGEALNESGWLAGWLIVFLFAAFLISEALSRLGGIVPLRRAASH